uniref:Putative cadherin egf lag seven-pass g-type receptor n=1 Tax=Anopheles braziliensis TaxID=58242 RepID=A0A2M3ZLJ6_9DIPT
MLRNRGKGSCFRRCWCWLPLVSLCSACCLPAVDGRAFVELSRVHVGFGADFSALMHHRFRLFASSGLHQTTVRIDPCLNACGLDAKCHVSLHVANCICPDGYEGDPFRQCTIRMNTPPPRPEPKDPCYPSPCGTNARCRLASGDGAVCECIENYFGNPYESCRPECVRSGDCCKSLACFENRWKDPCPGVCGRNAECPAWSITRPSAPVRTACEATRSSSVCVRKFRHHHPIRATRHRAARTRYAASRTATPCASVCPSSAAARSVAVAIRSV